MTKRNASPCGGGRRESEEEIRESGHVEVDKSKNLIIADLKYYDEKLLNEFSKQSLYVKLDKNPLQNDLKFYAQVINQIKPYISKKTELKLRANNW